MFGAIIGDIVGSVYEWNNIKTIDFELFDYFCEFTDDSIMTCAVAEGLMDGYGDKEQSRACVISSMKKFGHDYSRADYGELFRDWLASDNPSPYNSWGNGSAMRVSSAGWLYDTLSDVECFAKISAEVTHNHPEGIKGAQSVAAAIFLARTGSTKTDIATYVEKTYGYDLSKTCDDIRPSYVFDVSCQGSIPQAFAAFLEGNSYEEVVRLAVSLGGDSDTLAAIAGSMAEAMFGIPEEIKAIAWRKLTDDLRDSVMRFQSFIEKMQ